MERPTGTRVADCLVPVAVSLAAFALVITFFAPRFVMWSWLDLDSAEHHPAEFNRAIDTLRQLDNPFVPITNPTNRRHQLAVALPDRRALPAPAALGVPCFAGARVSAGARVRGPHLVRRESGAWWVALAAAALSGTTSWFFVSTGWLAYFDSWYVLGLLVAAFGRSKIATGLACLLTPWVDERFVLTLPLVLVDPRHLDERDPSAASSDGLRFVSFVAPYCASGCSLWPPPRTRGRPCTCVAILRPCTTWRGRHRLLVGVEGGLVVCGPGPDAADRKARRPGQPYWCWR